MKTTDEIQAAHDRLVAIVLGEVPNPFGSEATLLKAALDVLCWVLDHDHNTSFAGNLTFIDEFLLERGFEMSKLPIPFRGHPPGEG